MRQIFSSRILLPIAIAVACSAFLLGGCDIIEAPYLDPEYIAQLPADEKCQLDAAKIDPFPAGQVIQKKVLLEEMTGHKCGNCPAATETAYDLAHNAHPDQVILVTIHSGSLASFNSNSSKYYTDFTTDEGDELFASLNPSGAVPFGMVDRTLRNSNASSWPSAVEERLQQAPAAGLRIFNCFEEEDLELGTVIDVKFLQATSASQRLCIWLIESEVVDWQKDYRAPGGKPDLEDYTHHSVFRKALNGPWGEPLSDTGISAGQRFTKSYSLSLDPAYDIDQLKIVAFVYDFETQEVGQVEQLDIR